MQPTRCKLPEKISLQWVEENATLLKQKAPLEFDFSQTEKIEGAGTAFFTLLKKNRDDITLLNLNPSLAGRLSPPDADVPIDVIMSDDDFSIRSHFKKQFKQYKGEAVTMFSMLVEMLYWGTFGLLERRDFRKGVLGEQMYQLGYGALGIVIALTFLIGIALAAQSVIQLRLFGADSFLMSMVVMSMVRELGPLMVAIVLAGRTGSAITAEIATMSVQEEVDALKTMGLNHIQHIVAPKFWAVTLTMPFLSTIGIASGILGGVFIAMTMGGQSLTMIHSEFEKALILKDFLISIVKSFVFAWLVVWIGAYHGYKVTGGAEEVGRETTNSVVASIFVIVIADALFSFVYEIF